MRLIKSVTNTNFEIAFAIVVRDYRFPYDNLSYVKLVGKEYHISHAYGTFHLADPKNLHILVKSARRSIPEYINTLVHEFTHLQQYVEGRMVNQTEYEDEAYKAGTEAQIRFEKTGLY